MVVGAGKWVQIPYANEVNGYRSNTYDTWHMLNRKKKQWHRRWHVILYLTISCHVDANSLEVKWRFWSQSIRKCGLGDTRGVWVNTTWHGPIGWRGGPIQKCQLARHEMTRGGDNSINAVGTYKHMSLESMQDATWPYRIRWRLTFQLLSLLFPFAYRWMTCGDSRIWCELMLPLGSMHRTYSKACWCEQVQLSAMWGTYPMWTWGG